MRIQRFAFKNLSKDWQLLPVCFSNLTLLVGISGVGKTQILRSLASLTEIANGENKPGYQWSIDFEDAGGRKCKWSGEFDQLDSSERWLFEELEMYMGLDDEERRQTKIASEMVSVDDRVLIERRRDELLFLGKETPKLAQTQSALSLLAEEEEIAPVRNSFDRIIVSDRSEDRYFQRLFAAEDTARLLRRYPDIESIRSSQIPTLAKLSLAYRVDREIF